jgi:hypothetical protein
MQPGANPTSLFRPSCGVCQRYDDCVSMALTGRRRSPLANGPGPRLTPLFPDQPCTPSGGSCEQPLRRRQDVPDRRLAAGGNGRDPGDHGRRPAVSGEVSPTRSWRARWCLALCAPGALVWQPRPAAAPRRPTAPAEATPQVTLISPATSAPPDDLVPAGLGVSMRQPLRVQVMAVTSIHAVGWP